MTSTALRKFVTLQGRTCQSGWSKKRDHGLSKCCTSDLGDDPAEDWFLFAAKMTFSF
ncbi:hypothetical protein QUF80_22260 [Desulfococcaceae bacterium HSG8]|nr:hypothetical protein [Desulfococcaceae bacterium HSG8]